MRGLMNRWMVGVLCMPVFCVGGTFAPASTVIASAPLAAAASISGTVNGANGPASGVTVKVFVAHAKQAQAKEGSGKGRHAHAPAIAQGTTDAKGHFSIPNIANGQYVVVAIEKGVGVGAAKTAISGANVSVSITLKKHEHKAKKPAA